MLIKQCGGRGLVAASSSSSSSLFMCCCVICFRLCCVVFQMAVSQNTVVFCPAAVAVGGAEYGGGCFLFQLGRMGILSCLHRFFSGRWRALISRHKILFFSIISIMVASPQSQGIWKQETTQHHCVITY